MSGSPEESGRAYAAIEPEARAWLIRLRSGEATPEDAAAFKRWCNERPEHARVVALVSRTWSALDTVAAEIAAREPSSPRRWMGKGGTLGSPLSGRLEPRSGSGIGIGGRARRRAFLGVAVAAGAGWLALRPPLALWPAVTEFASDYRTGVGEQREVAFSDRVTVAMNTETRFDVLRTQERGIDLLGGETEIIARAPSPGTLAHPFVVVANRGRIEASVARFNVRRIGDEVCVTCVSGDLVFNHPQRQLTLLAGQQLNYNAAGVQSLGAADVPAVTAWRRGLLVFDNVPLAQMVDEINRYRPGRLIVRSGQLASRRVEARLKIEELDRVVEMIHTLYGARVTQLPGNIVLLS